MSDRPNLDDVEAFRREVPDWDTMPDEYLVKTLAFQGWLANRLVREFGRVLLDELRRSRLGVWLTRRGSE